jgi:hypothetical protein
VKYLMLMLVLMLTRMTVPALAEQFAVTKEGKTVLLKEDGTWEYTEEGARVAAEERREFWTDVAIHVAKVVGIIAALITLRLVIQAVGKGVAIKKGLNQQRENKGDPVSLEDGQQGISG